MKVRIAGDVTTMEYYVTRSEKRTRLILEDPITGEEFDVSWKQVEVLDPRDCPHPADAVKILVVDHPRGGYLGTRECRLCGMTIQSLVGRDGGNDASSSSA